LRAATAEKQPVALPNAASGWNSALPPFWL
jgi:hypothetical protein